MSDVIIENSTPLLSSLELTPGSIAFDPNVTEYHIQIGNDVEKLLISCRPAAESASYMINGNGGFTEGENLVTITVSDQELQTVYQIFVEVTENAVDTEETEELSEVISAAEEENEETGSSAEDLLTEEEEVSAPQTADKTQAAEAAAAETAAGTLQKESGGSSGGRINPLAVGIAGCAVLAIALGAAYMINRMHMKKEEEKEAALQRLREEKKEEHRRITEIRSRELAAQIRLLIRKDPSLAVEQPSGIRLLELSDEEVQSAYQTVENKLREEEAEKARLEEEKQKMIDAIERQKLLEQALYDSDDQEETGEADEDKPRFELSFLREFRKDKLRKKAEEKEEEAEELTEKVNQPESEEAEDELPVISLEGIYGTDGLSENHSDTEKDDDEEEPYDYGFDPFAEDDDSE